jgi:hypothetical protein
MQRAKWIGLAEVLPNDGCEALGSDRVGAIVNVVGFAADAREFAKVVESALADLNLRLLQLQDVEPYSARSTKHPVDPFLQAEARRVPGELRVAFGHFHTYPLEGNN